MSRVSIAVSVSVCAVLLLGACQADAPEAPPAAEPSTSAPAVEPSASEPAPEPSPTEAVEDESATEIGERLVAAVKSASKVVTITEDNDPNNLIGRPNGYIDAAVVYDDSVECDELGAACGVTIEIWPSAEDAEARSKYIQSVLKDAPILGSEYHTLSGAVLMRVSGDLKPSAAKEYEAALGA